MSNDVDALVGYTGFVGSNLNRQHHFSAQFNSGNIREIEGRAFRRLVFSGAQAKKWWANAHPDQDWHQIQVALDSLQSVRADRVVLISTIDVVPKSSGATEDVQCCAKSLDAYGAHRLELEQQITTLFEHVTIIRLPASFGRGLKKNVIYDLMHHNQVEFINPDSSYQYYYLDHLWQDINKVLAAGISLMHFATQPIQTKELGALLFPRSEFGRLATPPVHYDVRTKHCNLFGRSDGYLYSKACVLEHLQAFLTTCMKEGA